MIRLTIGAGMIALITVGAVLSTPHPAQRAPARTTLVKAARMSYPLRPCPASPNCVSSNIRDRVHYMPPIAYSGSREAAIDRVARVIAAMPRSTIVERRGDYLRAEFRSLVFRFVDDVEIAAPGDEAVLHFRSAARTGNRDFGVNRRRMEKIADDFAAEQTR